MSRPVLLDLFSGAGGAAKGYHDAGFDVIGVDINPQPRYPFRFVQGDALDLLAGWDLLPPFDAIHASPPCHDHSNVSGRNRKAKGPKGTGWMLAATVDILARTDVPWVVENVETAEWSPNIYRLRLCGSSFALDVRRHRWFASNVAMLVPPCSHSWQKPRFRSLDSRRPEGALASVVGVHGHLNYAGEFALRCQAMGIDWMTNDELSQAIPPAYTRFIGEQLLAHLAADPRPGPGRPPTGPTGPQPTHPPSAPPPAPVPAKTSITVPARTAALVEAASMRRNAGTPARAGDLRGDLARAGTQTPAVVVGSGGGLKP